MQVITAGVLQRAEEETLEPKVALVTGASRGIGRAIAQRLAASGAQVAVGYRTQQGRADGVVSEIQFAGGMAVAVPIDVCSMDSVQSAVSQIEQDLGPVAILVNNAGIVRDGMLARMREEDWLAVIDTNLSGVFRCTKAVLRKMVRQRWGRIVNISSLAGLAGNAGQTNYAAAKAGLVGFTRSLAKEVGSRNITVNAIAPGFIDTDMTRGLPGEWKEQILAMTPVGRFGAPSEVAAAVAFLASEAGGYITGQVVSIDGGLGMR